MTKPGKLTMHNSTPPRFFRLPRLTASQIDLKKAKQNGRLSTIAIQHLSSYERVMANTECLRKLESFLESSKKRFPS